MGNKLIFLSLIIGRGSGIINFFFFKSLFPNSLLRKGMGQKLYHSQRKRLCTKYKKFFSPSKNSKQAGDGPFNRALLMNVGYREALLLHPSLDCFIFHDVDLLPLDNRIRYSCGGQPVHLSANIDVHGNKSVPGDTIIDLALSLQSNTF